MIKSYDRRIFRDFAEGRIGIRLRTRHGARVFEKILEQHPYITWFNRNTIREEPIPWDVYRTETVVLMVNGRMWFAGKDFIDNIPLVVLLGGKHGRN